MSIAQNISAVRSMIAVAAARTGRDPASIKLIAVSKTKPVGDILEAVNTGQLVFGENYAQELRDKAKEIPGSMALEWHYIGHLQKNKIKYVLPVASWIHTIDSVELLQVILSKAKDPVRSLDSSPPNAAQNDKKVLHCLIEVNIAGEANKSGLSPDMVFELVKFFSELRAPDSKLALKGLMCMPPLVDDPETSRPYFKKLKNLLDEINSRNIHPEKLTELSMGMTQDFEVAIEEGSTMIRIGTAIFGGRQ